MTTKFRPFVGQAGEPLLAPVDPEHAMGRYTEFLALTGLDPSAVVTSTTASIPLPLYPDRWPAGRRRWNIEPSAMWHPLMWLPARIHQRARLNIGGTLQVENDELWAARVLVEMTSSGLYDEDQGWVDILALYGLDIDDPAVVARVRDWCAGQPDPTLDSIDLDTWLADDPDDPDWAFRTAWHVVRDLRPVAWVIQADYLLATIDYYLASPQEFTEDRLGRASDSMLALGWFAFSTLPSRLDPDWWRRSRRTRPQGRDEILGVLFPEAKGRLETIRSAYWDYAMDVVNLGEELTADDPVEPIGW